jgi:hypothetical protein
MSGACHSGLSGISLQKDSRQAGVMALKKLQMPLVMQESINQKSFDCLVPFFILLKLRLYGKIAKNCIRAAFAVRGGVEKT